MNSSLGVTEDPPCRGGLMYDKAVMPVGVARVVGINLPLPWWGSLESGCPHGRHPRHFIEVQNDEVVHR
ncbi:hypothetical protein TNCV_268571 [Trichonephila clavipes]|nr:hypothetical protein TNCV_268571 [Trichonephila clavipes]